MSARTVVRLCLRQTDDGVFGMPNSAAGTPGVQEGVWIALGHEPSDAVVEAMCNAEDAFVAFHGIDGATGKTIESRMAAIFSAAVAALAQGAK